MNASDPDADPSGVDADRPGVLTERELVVRPRRVESPGRRGSRVGVIGVVGAAGIIIGVGLFGGSLGRLFPSPTDRPSIAASPAGSPVEPGPTRPRSTPFGVGAGIIPGAWLAIPEGPIATRTGHTAVWTGREVIIWGGQSGLDDLGAAYDPASDAWRLIRPAPIQGRTGHHAVWTGHEVVVWGGTSTGRDGEPVSHSDGAAYEPATDLWRPIAAHEQARAGVSTTAWTGTEWIVLDGLTDAPDGVRLDVAAYDPAADSWGDLPGPAVSGGSSMAATWTGNALVLVVTADDGPAAAYRWTPDTGWEPLPTPPFSGSGSELLFTGTEVLVGGYGDSGDGLYGLDVGSWDWRQLGGPAGVVPGIAQVWTGVYAFYGDRAYDPTLDRWRTTDPLNAAVRLGASATWTGDRLIVWGGDPEDIGPNPTGTAFVPDSIRVEAASALPWVGPVTVEIEDRSGHLVSARPATIEEVRETLTSAASVAGFQLSAVPGDDHSVLARFQADPVMVSARLEIAPAGDGVAFDPVRVYGGGTPVGRGFVLTFDEPVDPFRLIGARSGG